MGDKHAEKPSCAQYNYRNNKENIFVNQAEASKLSPESINMKRRKKGGGYNLRKSLAWDRAFFTEEGVLSPLELSMISGKSSGERLLVLHENGRAFASEDSDSAADPVNLQELEQNLSRELAPSPRVDSRMRVGVPSQKHDPSAHGVCGSGSKRSGCPRSLPPYSLKRPANASTRKETTKDLNPSKVPKSNPHILTTPAGSATLGASRTKHNQIAQPAANVHKRAYLRGSPNNSKIVKKDAESGSSCKPLSAKSSLHHSRRNMEISALEMASSIKSRPVLVTEPKGRVKVISDPISGTGKHLSDKYSKIEIPRLQNAQTTGGDLQYAKPQTAKPSGLRMPSPSLGFFAHPKGSASRGLSQCNGQPCNPSDFRIPYLQRAGDLIHINESRIQHLPVEMPKAVNGVMETGHIRVLQKRTGFNAPCATAPVSHEKFRSNLKKIEVQVPCSLKSCERINNLQELPCIQDHAEKQLQVQAVSSKKESRMNDSKLQMNDNVKLCEKIANVSPESSWCEPEDPPSVSHIVNNGPGADDVNDHPHAEEKYCMSVKQCVIISENANINGDRGTYLLQSSSESLARNVSAQSRAKALLTESGTCKSNGISGEDNKKLQSQEDSLLCWDSRTFEELETQVSRVKSRNSNSSASNTISGADPKSPSSSQHECLGKAIENGAALMTKTFEAVDKQEIGLSLKNSEDRITIAVANSSVQIPQTLLNGSIQHFGGFNGSGGRNLRIEDNSPNGELPHELNGAENLTEDKDIAVSLEKPGDVMKQIDCVRPPPDAVPFSDEWLAAVEAAGEEILSMKSGAVQNSPPEKPVIVPGPWSPVKRKINQEIGPYDCTKFTGIPPPQ